MQFRSRRFILQLAGLISLAFLAGGAGYLLRLEAGLDDLQRLGRHRMALYAASLEREIDKYAYFPATLGLEQDVVDLVRALEPGQDHRERVSRYLERLNQSAGTLSIYVLDRRGIVLSTSNWRQSDSFMGEDLSYRPYFNESLKDGFGRFFGIGTTRGEPGYYLSSAIFDSDGKTLIGVAVVKVGLGQLERSWATVEAPVLVTDENDVVILSSVPAWKFTTLHPLDDESRATFNRLQHYNRQPLPFLGLSVVRQLDEQARLVNLPSPAEAPPGLFAVSGSFLAQSQPMPGTPWTMTVFSHLEPIQMAAWSQGALIAIAAGFVLILIMLIRQRTQHVRDQLRAREALQRAHDELERKVAARTTDLSGANERLQAEVSERVRAEKTLRAAQDELIQAGKLAVIGQLSAGIAHELNQPLTALRTLSANAAKFIERGDWVTARENLNRIGPLIDGMGRVTGQLKSFARKSPGQSRPVAVRVAFDNALFLLDGRLKRGSMVVRTDFPPQDLFASCESNRLEQVLVNLIGNAVDSMEESKGGTMLELGIHRDGDHVVLTVRDTGPGIAADILPHLFEPFFTTKDANSGLGLGLAISSGIIRDFGGTLTGANHPEGGAIFTVCLPASESDPAP